ncbi:MAG: 3-methyl-2-oxobutanoate hydroxymethyltransferase [Pseudomonadota bacterium]
MKKVTVNTLREMKARGEPIGVLTCYDATFARLLEAAGVEVILVGDSLGNVIQGHRTTLPVTVDHVVYHLQAVGRGLSRAHLVGDLPFMSYQASVDEAVANAGRLVKEGGAEAVKLEGGVEYAEVIRRIVRAGIPVMGHIGLLPQAVHRMGGYVVQGRSEEQAKKLLEDALALEEAGCYALVLEGIPGELAAEITRRLSIPTIGIGAGSACDGQVLVVYDLLGLDPGFAPKFVKRYLNLHEDVVHAVSTYMREVKERKFPAEEHTFGAKRSEAGAVGGLYGGTPGKSS